MKLRLKIMLISFVLLVCSCSPLDVIKSVVNPGKGIAVDTEIVAGDKHQEVQVGDDVVAETIVYNENNAPIWLVLIACAGWLLPTPMGMYRGIRTMRRKT